MHPIEIIVIVAVSSFVLWLIISNIIRRIKGKPLIGSECECCQGKGQKLVKKYHKTYKK